MISAVILTHNNERTINSCLSSIEDIVDEVIIIDDYSSDDTFDITSTFKNVKWYQRSLSNNFSSQRNFGIEQATHEWILHIDSDEFLTLELQEEISRLQLEQNVNYLVKRKNTNFHGFTIEKLRNRPLLACRNQKFVGELHEYIVSERNQSLNSFLVHDCWVDLKDFVDDINDYSYRKALTWSKSGRKYSPLLLIFRQLFVAVYLFVVRYFIQKRFMFGSNAFLYCLYWSSEEILVGLKFIELDQRNDL